MVSLNELQLSFLTALCLFFLGLVVLLQVLSNYREKLLSWSESRGVVRLLDEQPNAANSFGGMWKTPYLCSKTRLIAEP